MAGVVSIGKQMIDITAPEHGVEITINYSGQVVWVNVDGVCRLRVCSIDKGLLKIDDHRNPNAGGK